MRHHPFVHPASPGTPPLSAAGWAVVLAALCTIIASWPYLADVAARRASPRLVSWFIFAEVTAVGAAQAFRSGQVPAGALTAAAAVACLAVLGAGWRHGDRRPLPPRQRRLERACLAGGQAGVILLALSVPYPALFPLWAAVAVAVATDALAYAPTWVNGWKGAEPWVPFAWWTAGAAVTLAVTDWSVAAGVIYPAYLFAANAVMTGIVLGRRPRGRHAAPGSGLARATVACAVSAAVMGVATWQIVVLALRLARRTPCGPAPGDLCLPSRSGPRRQSGSCYVRGVRHGYHRPGPAGE